MYHTLVVEDDKNDAQRLTELLHRYGAAHNETFQVTWLTSAMDMLGDKRHFDLVLLDIDLPGISGMEAAELLRVYDHVTPVIFVTNLAKYAVKGYEVEAAGFVVKPVTYGSLSMALDRALRIIALDPLKSVMVPTEGGMRVIPLVEIVFVEVKGHNLTFHLEGETPFETRGSLAQVEEELEGAPVLRIAKNCLVNMDKILLVKGGTLVMSNHEEVRISRTWKKDVIKTITDYLGGDR